MTAGAEAQDAPARAGRRARLKAPDALRLDALEARASGAFRTAGLLNIVTGALWPVQAAVVAALVAGWSDGRATAAAALEAALAFVLLAAPRALLDHRAGAVVFDAADSVVAAERATVLARESRSARGGPPGATGRLALKHN